MHAILLATQKGGAGKSPLSAHFGALADREVEWALGVDGLGEAD